MLPSGQAGQDLQQQRQSCANRLALERRDVQNSIAPPWKAVSLVQRSAERDLRRSS